jgi:hypothetical protein
MDSLRNLLLDIQANSDSSELRRKVGLVIAAAAAHFPRGSPAANAQHPILAYADWASQRMGRYHMVTAPLSASYDPETQWGRKARDGLFAAEVLYAQHLLREQGPGCVVEFGTYQGRWINYLAEVGQRVIHGFDSFEGLPEPSDHDLDCWHAGQFAVDYETVCANVRSKERPWIKLHKGWFSETIPTPEVQAISDICFARIDCDLYEPTVEVLDYLTHRLTNGALLAFDDWTFDLEKGETRAFDEWSRRVPLRFEFLDFSGMGSLFVRVRR